MNCVFSKALIERWRLLYIASHRKNPPNGKTPTLKSLIAFYKKRKISCMHDVMECHIISTLEHVVEEARYKLCTKKELIEVGEWVNNNIVWTLDEDNYITQGVKIRIAISMLNKLCNKGVISKEESIFFFDNIVTNIKDCKSELMMEDLPF